MISLFNWSFLGVPGGVIAQGVVSGHYRLKNGAGIQTSWVRSVRAAGTGLEMLTFSGSHYWLEAGEMDFRWWENAKVVLPRLGVPAGFLRTAWNGMMETARQRQKRLEAVLWEGAVYFEIIGEAAVPQSAFLKREDGSLVQLGVSRGSDGFQDRIEISGGSMGKCVEIVYLAESGKIMPYSWGDVFEMWVHNRGKDTVSCRVEGEETLLRPGHTTRVYRNPVKGGALVLD